MTEDEAKQKACCGPYMIAAAIATADYSRRDEPPPPQINGYCVASACMAWREITALHAFDCETGEDLGVRHGINSTVQEFRAVPVGGFCGLAGAPQ